MTSRSYRPVLLCILDGWGWREDKTSNAIALANTPNWDNFLRHCPHSLLNASADHVGLPVGQMGNSEVGHMNIGAGRVVSQELLRIDETVAAGGLVNIPSLKGLISRLSKNDGVCHLIGLMSPGGVHSHQNHLAAIARTLAAESISVRVHAFLDGRDTPPRSGLSYVREFESAMDQADDIRIVTAAGRYHGMDRDQRWDRVERAYRALMFGDCRHVRSVSEAIERSYMDDVGDEFMTPVAVCGYEGMADGDGLLMGNFRADRVRQIMAALVDPEFEKFACGDRAEFVATVGLTSYSERLSELVDTMFPPTELRDTLGEVVSNAGLRQLRIAETEKYAHVTFFLNGGREMLYPREERILVSSPQVATYDLRPEMSAPEVTEKLIDAIKSDRFELIVVNFANSDMVGHTGNIAAAIKAVETVDQCLGSIAKVIEAEDGAMLITSDHGNVEQMLDLHAGQTHTAHTLNPVPLVAIGIGQKTLCGGRLSDVAPTVLALMGLSIPSTMTGNVLFSKNTSTAEDHLVTGTSA